MRSQEAERIWVILAGVHRGWWPLEMLAVADERMRTCCSNYNGW